MIYLSKPRGAFAVYYSQTSQGAYSIVRLVPGRDYTRYPRENIEAERDFLHAARDLADQFDLEQV